MGEREGEGEVPFDQQECISRSLCSLSHTQRTLSLIQGIRRIVAVTGVAARNADALADDYEAKVCHCLCGMLLF